MTICVVTDSTCDLPPAVAAWHHIAVVPCYINIGTHDYLDGVNLSRQEFYERLPEYDPPPKTAAPGSELFQQTYARLLATGATEIISIHIAASLSAVLNAANVAAQDTSTAITVFDSQQLSLGTGFLALAAADAARAGAGRVEIIAQLQDQILRTHSFAVLDTLEYLRRGGRISRFELGLASLLQIKPIFKIYAGEIIAEKTRTRRVALEQLLNRISALGALERLAVLHVRARERAEELRQVVQRLYPQITIAQCEEMTPVLGAHFGPGMVGIVCVQAKSGG